MCELKNKIISCLYKLKDAHSHNGLATLTAGREWVVLGVVFVMTGCRERSERLTKTSKGVNEHLCSKSGARLNSQAGDKMY